MLAVAVAVPLLLMLPAPPPPPPLGLTSPVLRMLVTVAPCPASVWSSGDLPRHASTSQTFMLRSLLPVKRRLEWEQNAMDVMEPEWFWFWFWFSLLFLVLEEEEPCPCCVRTL